MNSRLFHFVQFIAKCSRIFLELNSKGLYFRQKKKKVARCLVSTSSTKREIRHFHVVVEQRRQRNVQKSVMYVQSCCQFAYLTYCFFFCRSRCRHRLRCLSSRTTKPKLPAIPLARLLALTGISHMWLTMLICYLLKLNILLICRLDFRRLPGPVLILPEERLIPGNECRLIFPNSGW